MRRHPRPTFLNVLAGLVPLMDTCVASAETTTRSGNGAATTLGAWSLFTTALADRSVQIGEALRDFPATLARLVDRLSGAKGLSGLLELIGLLILVFGAAYLLEAALSHRMRRRSRNLVEKGVRRLGDRFSAIAAVAIVGIIEAGLFVVLATLGIQLAFASGSLQHQLSLAVGFSILATRIGRLLLKVSLSPQNNGLRLLSASDDSARRLIRSGTVVVALAATAYFGSGFLFIAAVPPVFANTWFMAFGLVVTVCCFFAIRNRHAVVGDTQSGGNEGPVSSNDPSRRPLGLTIRRVAPIVLIGAWIIWSINVVLGHRESAMAVLVCAIIVLLFPSIDSCFRTAIGWADSSRSATSQLDPRQWRLRFRLLLYGGRAVLIGAAIILALEAWGFGVVAAIAAPIGQKAIHALLTLAVAAPFAMMIWHGSQSLLERKLGPLPAPGDETPGTRAHTLVPILRTFLMILLWVIVAMMVLVSLGVEIGPLIAGAGIFGVAVGFGSQSLVRDVISGFFFLVDDAFRLGEYIDVGKCKGTVENISVRSLQLRHHRGALNTIPFGQIQSISNYTRDWVIEKLEFGLVYGTDPEKVRKLIKKIGQELAATPELAPDIIDPLKSQGLQRFGDSALIFRAKIKCRPGRQFTVRREAYRRMQEVFAASGIEMAYPTITYREMANDAQR